MAAVTVKRFSGGVRLYYDSGKFDEWCVYLSRKGEKAALKDTEYFQSLEDLAGDYGNLMVYDDFVKVFDLTTHTITPSTLQAITNISSKYTKVTTDEMFVDVLYTTLYMTMVAEENNAATIRTGLGKRIKRLGVHQILIDGESVSHAAHYSRGMKAPEIKRQCKQRGF